jgi:hydroxymethylglutaryl-CoA lyase
VTARPFVRLTEVGPRDGLQNEPTPVPAAAKVAFVDLLSDAGFPEIEVSSFVSPRWVPQLGDAAEVFARIRRRPGTVYSALVPNERGMEGALAARVDKVSVFAAASEGFSRRNTGGSVDEVLARFVPVVAAARAARLPVRGYVSCVVRCPYDGPTPPDAVRSVVERLLALGVDEIDLGETLGVAEPGDIARMYGAVARAVDPARTTLHLHDSNGRALDNARAALALGVRSFDSSAGGLGGCPYAPGARGNVDTLALAAMLDADGYETGVDRAAVERAISSIRHALRPAGS